MKMKATLLFLTLFLFACSAGIATPQTFPAKSPTYTPSQQPGTVPIIDMPANSMPTGPKIIVTVSTPLIDPGPNGELPDNTNVAPEVPSPVTNCGYQWAYQDLPELTAQFDETVKTLIPNSTSHATAYGENCLDNDGKVVRFLAMETDYYVIVSVETLDNHETFGNWIAQVMQAVNELPSDLVLGPKPGFVEFRLEKSMSERTGFRVPIQGYSEIVDGKTGEELFRLFYTEP